MYHVRDSPEDAEFRMQTPMMKAKVKRKTWILKNESMMHAAMKCTAVAIARNAKSFPPPSERMIGAANHRLR